MLGLNWPGHPSLCLFQVGDPSPELCTLCTSTAKPHNSSLSQRGRLTLATPALSGAAVTSTTATLRPRPPPQRHRRTQWSKDPQAHRHCVQGLRKQRGVVSSLHHFLRGKAYWMEMPCQLLGRCDGSVGAASPTRLRRPAPPTPPPEYRAGTGGSMEVCELYPALSLRHLRTTASPSFWEKQTRTDITRIAEDRKAGRAGPKERLKPGRGERRVA